MTPLPGTLTLRASRHCSQVHPDTCAQGACSPHAAGAAAAGTAVQGKWCSGPSLQTRRVRDRRTLRPQETRHVHGAQEAQQTALKGYLWEARVAARNCLNKQLFFISLCRGKAPQSGLGPAREQPRQKSPLPTGGLGSPCPGRSRGADCTAPATRTHVHEGQTYRKTQTPHRYCSQLKSKNESG